MIDRTTTNTIYEINKTESLSERDPACIFNTTQGAKELDTTQLLRLEYYVSKNGIIWSHHLYMSFLE